MWTCAEKILKLGLKGRDDIGGSGIGGEEMQLWKHSRRDTVVLKKPEANMTNLGIIK